MMTSTPDEPEIMLPFHEAHHAAAIMRAISEWARFEHALDSLIWQLARLEPEQGACLTAQFPGVMARLDALIALARTQNVPAKHIVALNSFRAEANGPREKRNRLVHDPWFYGYETGRHYRLQMTAKSKLEHAYKAVTEDEIKVIVSEFESLNRRFDDVGRALLDDFYSP